MLKRCSYFVWSVKCGDCNTPFERPCPPLPHAEPAPQLATLEVSLGGGSTNRFVAQVAGFGPGFLPECAPAGGASAQQQQQGQQQALGRCAADAGGGYSRPPEEGPGGSPAAGEQQQQALPPPPRPSRYGAQTGALLTAEGETDDYEDPDGEEWVEVAGGTAAKQAKRGAAQQEAEEAPGVCSVEGRAVAAVPAEACSRLENGRELAGAIAVVQRGE